MTDRDAWEAIEIGDTGRGMTEKEIEMATEPFYSTKTVFEGNGLGLSIVFGFTKQPAGDLIIESSPDIGTTLVLPFDRPNFPLTKFSNQKFRVRMKNLLISKSCW